MTDEAVSPLRRRMIEDMTIRKFAPKTQHDYVQRVEDRMSLRAFRADGISLLRACRSGYSYCVIIFHRLYLAVFVPQQGHRSKVLMIALIKRMRMVAIEFGMWRSGRKGGSPGSIIVY